MMCREANVAGPGFINFRMASSYWHREIRRASRRRREYFRPRKWKLRESGERYRPGRVPFRQSHRAAHGRTRSQRGTGRHHRAPLRGRGIQGQSRVLLQRWWPSDAPPRRVGARALSAGTRARSGRCPRTATRASTFARSRARCGKSGAISSPIPRIARSFARPR